MITKRTYTFFPNGDNPIISRIPLFDYCENEKGIVYDQKYPVNYEQIDDEIIISYQGEIMSLADFKRKIIFSD